MESASNNRERRFTYDALNRQTAEIWLDAAGNPIRTIAYVYDLADQLLSSSDSDSAYSYIYDADGRNTFIVSSTGFQPVVVLTQTFDAADQRVALAVTINGVEDFINRYAFDAAGRMVSIEQTGPGVQDKTVTLDYNGIGQVTRIERFAGSLFVASTVNFYDGADRLTRMTHSEQQPTFIHFPSSPAKPPPTLPDPSQNRQLLADYLWFYDAAGQMTTFIGPDGTSAYNYDQSSQLTAADHNYQTDEAYAWDANGNRTNGGFVTGPGNRLLSDGTFNYAYDAEGNRTRRVEIATGAVTEYEWDHRNRLTGLIFKDAQGNITKEAHYRYDVNNRRIEKLVDLDGAGSGVATAEGFVYDGAHSVLVFGGDGSLTSRYLFGPEVNQVLAEERIDGNPSVQNNLVIWAFGDHLGTVRDTLASSGRELNHISYDTFGRITNETNSIMGFFRFAHTGMELDRESGMQIHGIRYVDLPILRWLNEDPSGLTPDPNLFRYLRNNPTNAIDPSGLEAMVRKFNPDTETWSGGELAKDFYPPSERKHQTTFGTGRYPGDPKLVASGHIYVKDRQDPIERYMWSDKAQAWLQFPYFPAKRYLDLDASMYQFDVRVGVLLFRKGDKSFETAGDPCKALPHEWQQFIDRKFNQQLEREFQLWTLEDRFKYVFKKVAEQLQSPGYWEDRVKEVLQPENLFLLLGGALLITSGPVGAGIATVYGDIMFGVGVYDVGKEGIEGFDLIVNAKSPDDLDSAADKLTNVTRKGATAAVVGAAGVGLASVNQLAKAKVAKSAELQKLYKPEEVSAVQRSIRRQLEKRAAAEAAAVKAAAKKPRRVTNPKHHPNAASSEPRNVAELFDQAVVDSKGVRWAKDKNGIIHRFTKPRNGESHWDGSTGGVDPTRLEDIPIEIRRLLK